MKLDPKTARRIRFAKERRARTFDAILKDPQLRKRLLFLAGMSPPPERQS